MICGTHAGIYFIPVDYRPSTKAVMLKPEAGSACGFVYFLNFYMLNLKVEITKPFI